MKKIMADVVFLSLIVGAVTAYYAPKSFEARQLLKDSARRYVSLNEMAVGLRPESFDPRRVTQSITDWNVSFPQQTIHAPVGDTPDETSSLKARISVLELEIDTVNQKISAATANQIPWWLTLLLPIVIPILVAPFGKLLEPTMGEMGNRLRDRMFKK